MTRASLNLPPSENGFEAETRLNGLAVESLENLSPARLTELSHDMRAAVVAILGYCELLLDAPRAAADDRQRLDGIRANGDYLLGLLDSMFEGAQSPHPPTAYSPADLVHEVVASWRPSAEQCGLELRAEIAADLPRSIPLDALRVRRVLANLVGNAIKYSTSGAVVVAVDVETRGRSGKTLDPGLRLEVHDQGIGMSAEEVKQLMRPFHRGRYARENHIDGSGLGLAITRRLVDQLGGQLSVTSKPGEGTVFRVRLPLELEDVTRVDASAACAELQLAGRVLLVEDNPHHRAIIGEYLRQAGVEVEMVESGEAALRRGGDGFDAIILDQQLPHRNGRAVAQGLRAAGYSGPLLLLTADQRRARTAAPFSCVLSKSIGREELVAVMARWLPPRAAVDSPPPQRAERLRRLHANYLEQLTANTEAMRAAVERDDPLALRALTHRLMGTAGLYGLPELTELAQELDQAADPLARAQGVARLARRVAALGQAVCK